MVTLEKELNNLIFKLMETGVHGQHLVHALAHVEVELKAGLDYVTILHQQMEEQHVLDLVQSHNHVTHSHAQLQQVLKYCFRSNQEFE